MKLIIYLNFRLFVFAGIIILTRTLEFIFSTTQFLKTLRCNQVLEILNFVICSAGLPFQSIITGALYHIDDGVHLHKKTRLHYFIF